jgi:drug/metabolite transporter (DMT)-like permease
MIPYLAAFLAVICYAAVGPVIKKTGLGLPNFLFIGISSGMLALGAFVLLFLTEGRQGFFLPDRSKIVGFVSFASINLVGWMLYMYSIKLIPVAQYDMIAGLGILFTAVAAAILLNEPMHLRYIPAALFIIIGLYIAIGPDLWIR